MTATGGAGARAGALAVAAAALAFDPSAASAATPKIALAIGIALVALAPSLPARWREPHAPPAGLWLWLALAAWSLVSLAWSPHADPRTPALWLAAGAIALATSRLDPAARRAFTGRSALLVTAGASAVALSQHARGAEGVALHGAMGNPNWLGLSLACALPLVLGHAASTRGRERAAALLAAALGLAGLALAQSRVAVVALVVVGLVIVGLVVVGRAAVGRTAARLPLLVTAVAIPAAVLAAALAAGRWAEPLAGRWWLSEVSLAAWRQAPLFGHGSGAFAGAFLDAQGAQLSPLPLEQAAQRYLFVQTAHADWLQLGVEGGLVAIALGLLAFAVAFLGLHGDERASRPGAACLAVVALCMLGDAPLRQPAVVLLVTLALADTPALPRRSDRRDPLLAVALTVALACLLPRATTQWLAERAAHLARDAAPHARLATLERARRMAPWWSEPAFAIAVTELELARPERALDALDAAEAAGLVGPALHLARGNALVQAGRPAESIPSYQEALRLHPASFRAHANLAEAARQIGDLARAERHLARAADLRPHHPKLAAIAESLRKSTIDDATLHDSGLRDSALREATAAHDETEPAR